MGRCGRMNDEMLPPTTIFLHRFFGAQNELKLEEIETGNGPAGVLLPWIARLKLAHPLPTVIAHKFSDDNGSNSYVWYAIAHTEREFRDLREDLMAFVGPTWSNFRGEAAKLDLSHPLEAAVQEFTRGHAFKFSGDNKKIWDSLELMRAVWERSKRREVEDLRPPGR